MDRTRWDDPDVSSGLMFDTLYTQVRAGHQLLPHGRGRLRGGALHGQLGKGRCVYFFKFMCSCVCICNPNVQFRSKILTQQIQTSQAPKPSTEPQQPCTCNTGGGLALQPAVNARGLLLDEGPLDSERLPPPSKYRLVSSLGRARVMGAFTFNQVRWWLDRLIFCAIPPPLHSTDHACNRPITGTCVH